MKLSTKIILGLITLLVYTQLVIGSKTVEFGANIFNNHHNELEEIK